MSLTPATEEITALKEALASATKRSEEACRQSQLLKSELVLVRTERDLLQEQLNKFKRDLFAAKSEASAAHQNDLFFNEAEHLGAAAQPGVEETADPADAIDVPAHKRKKRGRKPIDPALPRQVVRHELPENERVCPHDGAVLVEIGVETSEQLDIIPQQVQAIRHERVKYACPCCDGTVRLAPKPEQVIPKGLFSEGLLAWVIASKYCDGLPLYRQSALLARFGGTDISRNTLAASVVRVGAAVQPVINLLRDHLLASALIYGDETVVQVLKEKGKVAQSKSYMWAQMTQASGADGTGPPIRLFAYSPSRSTQAAQLLYAGMREGSALMTDGYEPYNAIAATHHLVHLGCWAHCRRYVFDALQALPKSRRTPDQLAAKLMALIGLLYKAESQATEQKLDAAAIKALRQEHSVPVLAQIHALLVAHLHTVMPGSLLGKALHYLSSQWGKLSLYVEDGHHPIDNNACENSIRPFVVGRKNWLFSDTVAGANASANLYSLLETCKANGVNAYQYLRALLIALPKARTADDYEALLPWNIALSKN
jgi:transposase